MNKKNIILILLFACFVTTMSISIWGKKPELGGKILPNKLVIYDTNNKEITEFNKSSREEKLIKIEYTDDLFIYTFSVSIEPTNVTDKTLNYQILGTNSTISMEELSFNEWLSIRNESLDKYDSKDKTNFHYYKIAFTEQIATTIYFYTSRKDDVKDAYLMFTWFGTKNKDVIDI